MRQGHFLSLYFIIYLFCFLLLSIEQYKYDQVVEEKEKIESSLKTAIEKTAWKLTTVITESIEIKKRVIEEYFFENLYISLGLLQNIEEQQKLKMYLPMLLLIEEDGAFFLFMKEAENDGKKELQHMWSEKIPFYFPEESTESKKKAIIATTIESYASNIISSHNYIASQYGLSYSFYVPEFLQDTSETLNFPMLVAVFQGWPLSASGEIVYENCIDAGGYIQKVEKYVVEYPKSILQTVAYYHKLNCSYIGSYGGTVLEKKESKEQVIYQYGAYPCEYCIEKK